MVLAFFAFKMKMMLTLLIGSYIMFRIERDTLLHNLKDNHMKLITLISAITFAFIGTVDASTTPLGTKTASLKVCGDLYVDMKETILATNLLNEARTIAWVTYKKPTNLRGKYVFDVAYTDERTRLLLMPNEELNVYCNNKYK